MLKKTLILAAIFCIVGFIPKIAVAQDVRSSLLAVSFDDGRPQLAPNHILCQGEEKCGFYLSLPLIPGVYVANFAALGSLKQLKQLKEIESLEGMNFIADVSVKSDTKIRFGILSRHFNVKFEGGAEGAASASFRNEFKIQLAPIYTMRNTEKFDVRAIVDMPAKIQLERNVHLEDFVLTYGVGLGYKYRQAMSYHLESEAGVDITGPGATGTKSDEFLRTYGHGLTIDALLILDWRGVDKKKYIQPRVGIYLLNAYSRWWYQKNDFGLWGRDPRRLGAGLELTPYRILTMRFNVLANEAAAKPEFRVEASRWLGPVELAAGGAFNQANLLGDLRHLGYFNLGIGNKYVLLNINVTLDQHKQVGGFLSLKLGYNVDKIL